MAPTNPDAKRDYFDCLASKLDDPTAYLAFLEAKLENEAGASSSESGVHPVANPTEWVDPTSRDSSSSNDPS